MPDKYGINRKLVHYFEQLVNSKEETKDNKPTLAQVCLVGFVQQHLNKFDWKNDVSTQGSKRQDGQHWLGKLRSSWECSPNPLIDKAGHTVQIGFSCILEQSCGNDYYDQSICAKGIFIIETGAFLGFTGDSSQTNRLEAFCSTLHNYSI